MEYPHYYRQTRVHSKNCVSCVGFIPPVQHLLEEPGIVAPTPTITNAPRKVRQIVLNLGEVTYIDSTGLGVLVRLLNSAQKAGGNIKLAQLKPRLIDVLGVTKLMTVFETFDRAEDAVESFNSGKGEVKAG